MKKLTFVVHANIQQALADTLRGLPQVQGFTIAQVEGHGAQSEHDTVLAARDRVVGYTPHIRVDIVLANEAVAEGMNALRASDCGVVGRGGYWITGVDEFGRI